MITIRRRRSHRSTKTPAIEPSSDRRDHEREHHEPLLGSSRCGGRSRTAGPTMRTQSPDHRDQAAEPQLARSSAGGGCGAWGDYPAGHRESRPAGPPRGPRRPSARTLTPPTSRGAVRGRRRIAEFGRDRRLDADGPAREPTRTPVFDPAKGSVVVLDPAGRYVATAEFYDNEALARHAVPLPARPPRSRRPPPRARRSVPRSSPGAMPRRARRLWRSPPPDLRVGPRGPMCRRRESRHAAASSRPAGFAP